MPDAPSPASPAPPEPPEIVVVGCPSRDTVGPPGAGRAVVGGAAFLTALAARRAGARVGLLARLPEEPPAEVRDAFGPGLLDPTGLRTDPEGLPGFVITYDQDGRASYEGVHAGGEGRIRAADLPETWIGARIVHVSPLAGETALQLLFVADLRARGFRGLVSAGTFLRAVHGEPDRVRALVEAVDLFFCNREEAGVLWGGAPWPASVRAVVSDGPRAVELWEGGGRVTRPVPEAPDIADPTGAGDALAGGFLAGIVLGVDPCARGLAQARAILGAPGGLALLRRRIVPDLGRIARLAPEVARAAQVAALTFTGSPFPEADDPLALEILASATLHQYGFWEADDRGWTRPMWSVAGGRRWKGSDFVWQGFTRAAARDPSVLSPRRMATEPHLIDGILADDDGACPLPALEGHRRLHQAWGAALPPEGMAPLVARANESARPGRALLEILASMPGYAEDPLQKKAILLALILARRPERLLDLRDPESLGPIVDYHLMRGCLRTGCVHVGDPALREALAGRRWVDAGQEEEVREACWHALRALCAASGRSVAEVDGFFFSLGRRGCGEEAAPACEACPIRDACARQTDLFQPVYRTTAY